jgi:hypothetical protein
VVFVHGTLSDYRTWGFYENVFELPPGGYAQEQELHK